MHECMKMCAVDIQTHKSLSIFWLFTGTLEFQISLGILGETFKVERLFHPKQITKNLFRIFLKKVLTIEVVDFFLLWINWCFCYLALLDLFFYKIYFNFSCKINVIIQIYFGEKSLFYYGKHEKYKLKSAKFVEIFYLFWIDFWIDTVAMIFFIIFMFNRKYEWIEVIRILKWIFWSLINFFGQKW